MQSQFYFAIGACSYRFCRAFDGASFQKKNQDVIIFPSRDIRKIKRYLLNIFVLLITVGHKTVIWPVHFEYRRHYLRKSIRICSYSFSWSIFWKKSQGDVIFSKRNICKTKIYLIPWDIGPSSDLFILTIEDTIRTTQ